MNRLVDLQTSMAPSLDNSFDGVLPPRFRVLSELSRPGGQGRLFVVEDSKVEQGRGANGRLRSRRVVKVCRDFDGRVTDTARHRLWREFSLASWIHDANVITVFDHQRDEVYGDYFVMMYYEDAQDLRDYLRSRKPDADEAVHMIQGLARGVAAAHRAKVVHRDIKPSNFLMVPSGRDMRPVLIDFGIGESFGEHEDYTSLTRPWEDSPMTPPYASPEQWRSGRVGPESDLFSLGLVACEVLTGHRPYGEREIERLSRGDLLVPPLLPTTVPAWLAAAIHRLLSPDPSHRGTADDLLDAFTAMVGGAGLPDRTAVSPVAKPDRTRARFTMWPRTPWLRRLIRYATVIAMVLGILTAAIQLWKWWPPEDPELTPVTRALATLWDDGSLENGCVDVVPLRHDTDRSFTEELLVPQLRRTVPKNRGLLLSPQSGDVANPAPDCAFRVTGTLLRPPMEGREAVANLVLSRRALGSDSWQTLTSVQVGDSHGLPRYPELFAALSFDTAVGSWRGVAIRSARGSTDPRYACGEMKRMAYAESAVRKALATIATTSAQSPKIKVLRQSVWERQYNAFEAQIVYVVVHDGEDPRELLPCSPSDG
jgi:hypothetical protein